MYFAGTCQNHYFIQKVSWKKLYIQNARTKKNSLLSMCVYICIYFYFSINCFVFLFTTENMSRMLI